MNSGENLNQEISVRDDVFNVILHCNEKANLYLGL